jgi:hypothetical protein
MDRRRGRSRAAYDDWQAKRQDDEERPSRIAEGTLAAAFSEYRQTQEWAAKAVRTREEWERCWAVMGPAIGPCRPMTVTLAQVTTFRDRKRRSAPSIWRPFLG